MTEPPRTADGYGSSALADPRLSRRLGIVLLGVVIAVPLLASAGLLDGDLVDARSLAASGRFLAGFWPPAHDLPFLARVLDAAWSTIAIATAGLAVALLVGAPLGALAAEALSRRRRGRYDDARVTLVRLPIRALLIVLRGVPELVWALLLVRLVGLGPSAGVAAVALTGTGLVGKAFAEILDATAREPAGALLDNGASATGALLFGALPAGAPDLLSYTAYRWECAVRTSAVLGFVGAGGLGQEIDLALRQFDGSRVATLLLALVLLVALADRASTGVRRTLERDG